MDSEVRIRPDLNSCGTDLPFLPALAEYFAQRPEVVAAYLFGSQAEGVARPDSDVDLAVYLDPVPDDDLGYRLDMMEDTRRIAGKDTEIVILNQAPLLLQFQVIQKGIILYERSGEERAYYEMSAVGRYYDYQRYLDFYTSQLAKRIKEEGLGAG